MQHDQPSSESRLVKFRGERDDDSSSRTERKRGENLIRRDLGDTEPEPEPEPDSSADAQSASDTDT